jgi:ABC-type oligopeptide transport system substrate-binding subunit
VDAARSAPSSSATPSYWNKDRVPRAERWCCCPIPDVSTAHRALLSGRVDWIEAPAPDSLDKLKAGRLQDRDQRHPAHVALHAQHAARAQPTADIRVRKAMNLGDRPRRHVKVLKRARRARRRLRAARPSVVRQSVVQDQI